MCGLYGFSNYSGEKIKNLLALTNSLAEQSAIRGTDATGVAFTTAGGINIIKDSKSAYRMDFKHPEDIVALIGHTRHSTQGSEKKNYNNHPFAGKYQSSRFALAHNGVLCNDRELRKSLHLPKTRIETDSFIYTYNTALKNRLAKFSKQYPSIAKLTATHTCGGVTYEIDKKRLSIRLTAPYSEERKQKARMIAQKQNNLNLKM